jgi:hypothetical protein
MVLTYNSIFSEEELQYILNSDSLFGRKFLRECINTLYNKIYILKITNDDEILSENWLNENQIYS